MKILLVGEFSGLFSNLKIGLLEAGYDVTHINSSDGWKKIGQKSKYIFSNRKNRILNIIESVVFQIANINKLKNYDIVHFIDPMIFGIEKFNTFGYNYLLIKKLITKNSFSIMSVAGDHYKIALNHKKWRYSIYQDSPNFLKMKLGLFSRINYFKVMSKIKKIIPIEYTYAEAYRNDNRTTQTIPIPFNYRNIIPRYYTNENKKIRILHGVNRPLEKGTKYIIGALKRIAIEYEREVEVKITYKLNYEKYKNEVSKCDIFIDQCLSYGYTLNALLAMANGKIVLSGNEPEQALEYGFKSIPIININPSSEQIYQELKKIIENPDIIKKFGVNARSFVENNHDPVNIAENYINVYQDCINGC